MNMTTPEQADEAARRVLDILHHTHAPESELDRNARIVAAAYTALVAERDALRAALTEIETILLPHKQTSWLSSDGKRIMEILRAALRQGG